MKVNSNIFQSRKNMSNELNVQPKYPANIGFHENSSVDPNMEYLKPSSYSSGQIQTDYESYKNENNISKNSRSRRFRNPWGNLSYANLIAAAILSSPKKKMKLNEIYLWFVKNVTYFADREEDTKSKGWKNSIRHNLSLKREFLRESGEKKAGYWSIDEKLLMDRIRLENRQINDPQYNRDMEEYEAFIKTNFTNQQHITNACITEHQTSYINGIANKQEITSWSNNHFQTITYLNENDNPFLCIPEQHQNNINNFSVEQTAGLNAVAINPKNVLTSKADYQGSERSNQANSDNCLSSISKGSKIFPPSADAHPSIVNMSSEAITAMGCTSNNYSEQNPSINLTYVKMATNQFGPKRESAPIGGNVNEMPIYLSGNANMNLNDQFLYQQILLNYQIGNQINNHQMYLLSNELNANGNPLMTPNGLDPQLQFCNLGRPPMNISQKQLFPENFMNFNAAWKPNINSNIQTMNNQTSLPNGLDFNLYGVAQNLLVCNPNND